MWTSPLFSLARSQVIAGGIAVRIACATKLPCLKMRRPLASIPVSTFGRYCRSPVKNIGLLVRVSKTDACYPFPTTLTK